MDYASVVADVTLYCCGLAIWQSIFGPQKIFARTSLTLMLYGALFATMMEGKSAEAATLGEYVACSGVLLVIVMLTVNIRWRLQRWSKRRRIGGPK